MSGEVLISVEELATTSAVILDVRWALGDPDGRRHFVDGHISGAVYVDLETELAAPASAAAGRHPLPALADLQQRARRWGIDDGSSVVVYDATGGLAAARAWWLLRWGGLTDVQILDGGFPAWTAAGKPVESGAGASTAPGAVTLRGNAMPTIDIDTAGRWSACGVLLDARAGERYRGETEPIDPRAGHIPGALNLPTSENLDGTGHFKSADDLRARFAALRDDVPVAVYCGSGVTAAHQIAALSIAGIEATLYPGSWSQWSNDPDRGVEVGVVESL